MTRGRTRRIVIGIGNPDRGDDGAGREVVRCLKGLLPDDMVAIEHDGEAMALMARFEGVDRVYLIDACSSDAPTGTVRRFDVGAAPLPQGTSCVSTHGFGLAEAIELARTLGQLPSHSVVYAIEGASFQAGAPLSAPVADAVSEAADLLLAEIVADTPPEGGTPCTKHR